ncbi:MAG: ATP-binding protein [Ruminococcus sp.]|nr:ATP-binding protein [Ruminococcus sp.]
MTKYSEKAFDKAEAELSRRRKTAEDSLNEKKLRIEAQYPEIRKLNSQLEKTSYTLMKTILAGGSDVKEKIAALKQENFAAQEQLSQLLQAFTGEADYLDPVYTCPDCCDTGYVNGIRCHCFKELLKKYSAEELCSTGGIAVNDFAQFRLDVYDGTGGENSPREKMSQVFRYCRSYAEDFSDRSPSLLFIGKTGLGKTFVSSCIAKTVLENGHSVVFGSLIGFLRKIEDEHFGRAEGDTNSLLADCDLLILDDLGSEFRTSFSESALYEMINSRINLGKPTIISTNLNMSELNERYNDRIISRLMGCFDPIMFYGKDIRPQLRNLRSSSL